MFALGLTPACCRWVVDGDPNACPTVLVADCDFNVIPGTGCRAVINMNETCDPTPVEDTTWGRVKAMFDE